jgi:hypothetical protein
VAADGGAPDGAAKPGETFRPPQTLRLLTALFGLVCGWAAIWQAVLFVTGQGGIRAVAALLLFLPALLTAAIWRRTLTVSEGTLTVRSLFGVRRIPWGSVRYVDRTRSSFVIATDLGHISAGWLEPAGRQRLLQLIIQRARLTPSQERLRWGLLARYVPRTETITFQSHVNRRKRDSED